MDGIHAKGEGEGEGERERERERERGGRGYCGREDNANNVREVVYQALTFCPQQ